VTEKTGWELAETYQYDLVILDLMFPKLAGGEVLKGIRKSKSQVPVLILTARDSLSDKVEHFEAGADDYLTKPFAFAELMVRIKALLRRGQAWSGTATIVTSQGKRTLPYSPCLRIEVDLSMTLTRVTSELVCGFHV